jgi:hypothetical protein
MACRRPAAPDARSISQDLTPGFTGIDTSPGGAKLPQPSDTAIRDLCQGSVRFYTTRAVAWFPRGWAERLSQQPEEVTMFSLLRMARRAAAQGIPSAFVLASVLIIAPAAVIAQTFSTDCLPPQTTYVGQFHAKYADGTNVYDLTDPRHADFVNCDPPPGPGGSTDHTMMSMVGANMSINGGPPMPVTANALMRVRVDESGQAGPTRFFDTELLQLDLVGGPFMIRESPSRPSTGKTAITDLGGGLYHIDSFFDVFTELSLDGGQSWLPSTAADGVTPYAGRMQIPGTVNIAKTRWGNVKVLYQRP